jgi:hypothetical protein
MRPPTETLRSTVRLGIVALLLGECDASVNSGYASGYNDPRGYDEATLKLVFSADSAQCLNRFIYDSKLAPSRPAVVSCDGPDARIRDDGFHANAPGCIRKCPRQQPNSCAWHRSDSRLLGVLEQVGRHGRLRVGDAFDLRLAVGRRQQAPNTAGHSVFRHRGVGEAAELLQGSLPVLDAQLAG